MVLLMIDQQSLLAFDTSFPAGLSAFLKYATFCEITHACYQYPIPSFGHTCIVLGVILVQTLLSLPPVAFHTASSCQPSARPFESSFDLLWK